ncbi:MAG: DNA/RNA nuclease SfsA [Peptococcaceae bacterium]
MDYYFGELEKGVFIKRENRFLATVELQGKIVNAHVPNTGRMAELLVPGAKVWVEKAEKSTRKTGYDLLLVNKDGFYICLNAQLANTLFAIWLAKGKLPDFKNCIKCAKEKIVGKSRIDFFLEFTDYSYLVEVKSVNLVENKTAKFPDAPTVRGSRHLEELLNFQKQGQKAAVVFIVMREDAEKFSPNDKRDPLFGDTLRKAGNSGVEVYAYTCLINPRGITFAHKIEVNL